MGCKSVSWGNFAKCLCSDRFPAIGLWLSALNPEWS